LRKVEFEQQFNKIGELSTKTKLHAIKEFSETNEAACEMAWEMACVANAHLESKMVTSVLHHGQTHDTKHGLDQVLLPNQQMQTVILLGHSFPHSLVSLKTTRQACPAANFVKESK